MDTFFISFLDWWLDQKNSDKKLIVNRNLMNPISSRKNQEKNHAWKLKHLIKNAMRQSHTNHQLK